ncbi:hypothetical protein [Psychrobacter aquaticus]|uniref:Uncharacterized protein n=1 Tax=Psychrobacter aquaticus CMS 56 TaxID=1354303 RepID=U4T887_9GAMM|nr:hypothetical protein [Psychrobacter aquaticus]ERL54944.1 hypothetical protein M917_2290 [Psychrobacter aquaticus CMS 56]
MKLPFNFNTSKTDLKVGGGMSQKGADIAGIILASSGLIVALAVAAALIILAIAQLNRA